MINIDSTLDDLLAGIGWQAQARHVSLSDPADERLDELAQFHLSTSWLPTGPDITVGPGRLYLKKFPAASYQSIFSDLVRPVQAGTGNAVKRGNGNDHTKSISLEHYFTTDGVVVSITDQGDGFDYQRIRLLHQKGERYSTHNGGGLKLFEKCGSTITYENGGRTLLIQYRVDAASHDDTDRAENQIEQLELVDELYKLMKRSPQLFFVAKCAPSMLNAFWTNPDFIKQYIHPALPDQDRASHAALASSAELDDTNKQAVTIQYALAHDAIVAKFYRRSEQGTQTNEILSAACQGGLGTNQPNQVPKPLAYYADSRLLLTTAIEGIALNRLLAGDIEDLVRGCRAAARWLLDFHATPLAESTERDVEREEFRKERGADTACANLFREFGAELENRAKILRDAGQVAVPTHGDFRAENVLLNEGLTGVINFDRCRPGEAASDIATFAFHLWKRTFKDTGQWQRAEIASQAFLTEYGSKKPEQMVGVAYYWINFILKSLERYAQRPGSAESIDHFAKYHIAQFNFVCRCEEAAVRPSEVLV